MEQFMKINTAVNGFVWGPVMLVLLVGTGIYLSIAVGFIQFTKIGYWWKNTIGKIFKKGEAGDGEITPLQAVSTALASTVGTGNIAGVTGAIILGGPGAVFWMWVSALFGMVTKFSEVTLAVKYRERNEKGDWCGGPMYYIKNGLGPKWKWLGGVFAVLGAIAAFGIGNIAQVHSIADSVKSVAVAFNENAASRETMICLITGICVAIFVALVLLGGVKRIGQVTEKLVPLMAVIYIVCALIVVFANVSAVPGVFASIFKGAFNPAAVTGGAGAALLNAALVLALSTALVYAMHLPVTGLTFACLFMMAGFSLLGKNLLNILPVLLGGWLYAKFQGEPFSKYIYQTLFSTCLSPLVSFWLVHLPGWWCIPAMLFSGVAIGFFVPPIAGYTVKLHQG